MILKGKKDGLLEEFFYLIEDTSPLKVNYEDFIGITAILPELSLEEQFFLHTCGFCQFAKRKEKISLDCFRNKRAVNRIVQNTLQPLHGLCHLGMTDIVYPVVVHDTCVGALFYGSVLVIETESEAKRRILRYCARRNLAAEPYFERLRNCAKIKAKEIAIYKRRLRLVARMLEKLILESGVPLDKLRREKDAETVRRRKALPLLLRAAIQHIEHHYSEPLHRENISAELRCNPTYLSSLFTRNLGIGLREYITQFRVERAKVLLLTGRFTAAEVAYTVGFEDQSHFGRAFKKLTGTTPARFHTTHR